MASATDLAAGAHAPPAPAATRRRRSGPPWSLRIVSATIAVLFAAPFGYLLVRNLGDLSGTLASIADPSAALAPLIRSLSLAAAVSVTTAVIGTGAAWLTMRTDLPGRRLWRLMLPLPLVIPSFIGAFTLIAAFAPGGVIDSLLAPLGLGRLPEIRGFAGAFGVLTLLTYPYVYLPVAARINQLPPSLEEAARLFGRSPLHVFRSIVLPQIRGSVLAGALLVFLYAISDFGAVELLRYDTLTRTIYATRLYDQPLSLALSLQLGLLALLIVASQRRLPVGRARSGGALRGLHVPLRRWRVAALAAIAGLLGLALGAPMLVLGYWSVRGLLRGSTRASALVGDLGALVGPAWHTTQVSLIAAVVAVVASLPIAYLTVRYRSRTGELSNSLVVAGFALPGLAIALALVFWTLRAAPLRPIYQTTALLVFAYVSHFGAQSLGATEVAVASVPGRLDDAARALGAGRVRRLTTIDLPLMLPGLLAGGGLVMLSTMKELPATLLLAPPGFDTLATRIWTSTQDAFLADASIASLVLIALSGLLTWILVVRRSDAL